MFDVTYLGHQGWLVEAGATRVLVDPLLTDGVGNMGADALEVYPPRRIDLASFPAVDAVVVTHEHPDHLAIPTLLRLGRGVRALLPARASVAARALLADLGMPTTLLRSGEAVIVGDLEIHPFHSTELTRDEWDVAPLVLRDRAGHGSLATSIDAPESPEFARFAAERAGRPGIWATSHNQIDLFPVTDGARQQREDEVTARLAQDIARRVTSTFRGGALPEVVAVLSSGFSFTGDLAWMNAHVFPAAAERLGPVVAARLPGTAVRAPAPGHRLRLEKGRLADEAGEQPFLGTKARSEWPPHAAAPFGGAVPDYGPASGRRAFEREDLERLLEELRGFARHLYGGPVFRALLARPQPARGMEVGFYLRTEGEPLVLAYRPEACAFEVAAGVTRGDVGAGLECWASDLLAVLGLDLFPGYLLVGRYRKWGSASGLRCELDAELLAYTHPLRQPERTLALYRRTAEALRSG